MKSNLMVSSNLMIDDENHKSQNHYLYIPGDYVSQIYRELANVHVAERRLSPRQLIERDQYLVCLKCHKPCAGTCEIAK